MRGFSILTIAALGLFQVGCGSAIPQLHEPWDDYDPEATTHMEKQIKLAVLCELRRAIFQAPPNYRRRFDKTGKNITSKDDQLIPDSWGAQVTLTFQVDETGKFNPGVSILRPLAGPGGTESVSVGLGGLYSSQASRIDKFDTYYTVQDLHTVYSQYNDCNYPPGDIYPKNHFGRTSRSSLFTVVSDLGIEKWLLQAADVSGFERSSRRARNGEGTPIASPGFSPDSFSYDVKFIVTTEANVTPVVKLVRVSTPASPALFDLNRTRTHELLITMAPSAVVDTPTSKGVVRSIVPNTAASQSHFAQEIGNAVANAIRGQALAVP